MHSYEYEYEDSAMPHLCMLHRISAWAVGCRAGLGRMLVAGLPLAARSEDPDPPTVVSLSTPRFYIVYT